jgi:hypothetical protein
MACPGDYQHQPWRSRYAVSLLLPFYLLNKMSGIIPWIDPTPNDIKQAASRMALALPVMARFLFNADAVFAQQVTSTLDTASWRIGSEVLWLATNLSNGTSNVAFPPALEGTTGKPLSYWWLLSENVAVKSDGVLEVGPFGSAIFVISEPQSAAQSQLAEHDEL